MFNSNAIETKKKEENSDWTLILIDGVDLSHEKIARSIKSVRVVQYILFCINISFHLCPAWSERHWCCPRR